MDDEQSGGSQFGTEQGQDRRADGGAVFPDLKLGEAWGESITTGRAAELEAKLQARGQEAEHGERKGPFHGVLLTGADVFWLAARALAGTSATQAVATQMARLRQVRHDGPVRIDPDLSALHLAGASLVRANLAGASLGGANLMGANLHLANLVRADLGGANLAGATLVSANVAGASLGEANLTGAVRGEANLTMAALDGADLTSAVMERATLCGADLTRATFATRTDLRGVVVTDTRPWYRTLWRSIRRERKRVYGPLSLADIRWNGVDLTVVDWSGLRRLGDERGNRWWGRSRTRSEQAARANIQLAKKLRDAGLNEEADRFAYRAQVCQRGVHLLRGRILRWLFSWFLFVIAGYGYRPLRTLFWYLAVIGGFAFAFYLSTHGMLTFGLAPSQVKPPFHWYEALVLSVSSFHGRGFFQPVQSLGDPVAILAAAEAVFGLFIEVSFIATFTQRYFGK